MGACWLHATQDGYNSFHDFCAARYTDKFPETIERSKKHCFTVAAGQVDAQGLLNESNQEAYTRFEAIYEEMAKQGGCENISFLDVFEKLSADDQAALKIFSDVMVRNYMGADTMAELSASDLLDDESGVVNPAMPSGLSTLVQCMVDELEASGVKILHGTSIQKIDDQGNVVKLIDRENNIHEADQAIVTVSTGVLKSGNIDLGASLSPELSHYLEGIQAANMAKIIVPLDKAKADFAPVTNIYYQDHGRDILAIWNATESPVLQMLIGGKPAVELEKKSLDNHDFAIGLVHDVFSNLPEFKNAAKAMDFENMVVTRWNVDTLTMEAAHNSGMQAGDMVLDHLLDIN